MLLLAAIILGIILWPRGKSSNFIALNGPAYREDTKLVYLYQMGVSESLSLKSAPEKAPSQTSQASFKSEVTLLIEKNEIADGGHLVLLLGIEPQNEDLI